MTDLNEAIKHAVDRYESLSAVDKALADEQQRRSWVFGETGRDPGYSVLALEVLRLRGEVEGQRQGRLTSKDAERLQRLRRRAYHLENRIERNTSLPMTDAKMELSALRWAIQWISGEPFGAVDRNTDAK